MNKRCTVKIPGEYPNVSRTFFREWPNLYRLLAAMHAKPITREDATALIAEITPDVSVQFRGYRGRANRTHKRITLPNKAEHQTRDDDVRYLRFGLVIHECAHMQTTAQPAHGQKFCEALAALVKRYAHVVNETDIGNAIRNAEFQNQKREQEHARMERKKQHQKEIALMQPIFAFRIAAGIK